MLYDQYLANYDYLKKVVAKNSKKKKKGKKKGVVRYHLRVKTRRAPAS